MCKARCACPGWARGSACWWDAGGMLERKGRVRCAPRVACVADGGKKYNRGRWARGQRFKRESGFTRRCRRSLRKTSVRCRPCPGSWRGWTRLLALGGGAMPESLAGAAGAMAVSAHTCTSARVHVHEPVRAGVHRGPRCRALVPAAAAFGLGFCFGCGCIPRRTSDGRCF